MSTSKFLAGAVIGLVAGLLLAPEKGSDLRANITDTADKLKDRVNGLLGRVGGPNLDGQAWGAENGYYQTSTNFNLEIVGTHNTGSRITLVVSPYNGKGTYQLNGITKVMFSEAGVDYTSTTGQITITSDDGQYIEGIFSCQMISNSGSQSLNFTNGQFLAPRR